VVALTVYIARIPKYPTVTNKEICLTPIISFFKLKEKASSSGSTLYVLGQHELNCKSNVTGAIRYFERAVDAGDIESSYFLGNLFTGGLFPEKKQQGITLLEFAAKSGHLEAQRLLKTRA
jgi:TPR repeat protein